MTPTTDLPRKVLPVKRRATVRDYVEDAIKRRHKHLPADAILNLDFPRNRGEARRSLRRKGPWNESYPAPPRQAGYEFGRARRKRNEARARASAQ